MSFGLARGNTDLLFCQVDWHSAIEHRRNILLQDIAEYGGDRLLNTSSDDLAAYFAKKYEIDVPVLHDDEIVADQGKPRLT